jgi:hypothetical protein
MQGTFEKKETLTRPLGFEKDVTAPSSLILGGCLISGKQFVVIFITSA